MTKDDISPYNEIRAISYIVSKEEAIELLPKAEEMIKFCIENEMAMGLAAPQIGINKRMFVMLTRKGEYQVIFNPKIFIEKKKPIIVREKCFSVSDETFYYVRRNKEIRVVYFIIDEKNDFTRVAKVLRDEEAIIFTHENDHLDGISIIDIGEEVAK